MSILGRVVLKSGLGDHAPHRRGLDICVFARKANAGKRGPGRDETAPLPRPLRREHGYGRAPRRIAKSAPVRLFVKAWNFRPAIRK